MTKALENRDFCVYYQPKYRAKDRKLSGAEALVRWMDPEWGRILPGKFIPLFESNGFITELDRYVFHEVCRQVRQWLDEGLPVVPISVNISRLHLYNPHFMGDYEKILEQYRIPARLLQLELTESTFFDNRMVMQDIVACLHRAGFAILMDDFGTGYSALEILKQSPADIVKIDRAFVKDIQNSHFDATFIRFIVELCHNVGIKVCLEGVETPEEYEAVRHMRLDYIQGYLFGRPVPGEEFDRLC